MESQGCQPVVGVAIASQRKVLILEIRHTVTRKDPSGAYGSFQKQTGVISKTALAP